MYICKSFCIYKIWYMYIFIQYTKIQYCKTTVKCLTLFTIFAYLAKSTFFSHCYFALQQSISICYAHSWHEHPRIILSTS